MQINRNKSLEDIFAENDLLQNNLQRKQEEAEAALFAAHPKLQAWETEKKHIIAASLQEMSKSPQQREAIKQAALQAREVVEAKMIEYRKENNLSPVVQEVSCQLCHGRGRTETGDLCICIKERMYEEVFGGQRIEALEGSFVAYETQRAGVEEEQRLKMQARKALLLEYAEKFPENEKKQLLFLGEAGLGKSFAMGALLKEIQKKERDICYISAARLFSYFHKVRLGEAELTQPLYQVKVLVIDDLGSEPMTQNVTREVLFELLEERKKAGRYTLFITNHGLAQLKERYTERVFSRLLSRQDSLVIPFEGKDLRLL